MLVAPGVVPQNWKTSHPIQFRFAGALGIGTDCVVKVENTPGGGGSSKSYSCPAVIAAA
jgi:hypothetical protein